MGRIYNGQNQKRRAFRTWWSGKDQSGGRQWHIYPATTTRMGKISDGNTISDFDKEEIKRRFFHPYIRLSRSSSG